MPESTFTPGTPAADPLKSVADALSLAAQAARDGAADAQVHVSEMMPAVGGFLSRLTYTTCYAVSYGVVFPTLWVAQTLPKDNAFVHGLVDGAHAARDAVAGRRDGFAALDDHGSETHHGLIIVPGDNGA